MSPSTTPETPEATPVSPAHWPTETEVYILPDGQVIFADLPAELATRLEVIGPVEPWTPESDAVNDGREQ
jgi:hypothetical protein